MFYEKEHDWKGFLRPDSPILPSGTLLDAQLGTFGKEHRSALTEMVKAGAAAVCPHPLPPEFRPDAPSTLSPEYLSEEYFRAFGSILENCEKLGMSPYIYDEGGWPSGSGCGRVLTTDPLYRNTRRKNFWNGGAISTLWMMMR